MNAGGPMTLSPDDIKRIVALYMDALADDSADDDPVSDGMRLIRFASLLPGARDIEPVAPLRRRSQMDSGFDELTRYFAEMLHAINPSWSCDDWRRLYGAILSCRYGSTGVRIKARPKASKLEDACVLSLELWQEKYGNSRSHYYSLRKEAVRLGQAKAAKNSREK